MELRVYFDQIDDPSRFKFSAFLSILFHGLVFIVGGLLMADQAEYGVAGVVPGGGQPKRMALPAVEMVEFIADPSDVPVARRRELKTRPTVPAEAKPGPSGGAYEIPSYYRNPPPPYPEEARRLKAEGTAVLRVAVNAEGKVVSASISQSTGFSALDLAALETVKTWRFKPARIAGIPISTSVNIPVNFRLQDVR